MIQHNLSDELLSQLDSLTVEQQLYVLNFARGLASKVPVGVPGQELIRFSGFLPTEEANEISDFIESNCEQVDPN